MEHLVFVRSLHGECQAAPRLRRHSGRTASAPQPRLSSPPSARAHMARLRRRRCGYAPGSRRRQCRARCRWTPRFRCSRPRPSGHWAYRFVIRQACHWPAASAWQRDGRQVARSRWKRRGTNVEPPRPGPDGLIRHMGNFPESVLNWHVSALSAKIPERYRFA
jgi:hypothetical protein